MTVGQQSQQKTIHQILLLDHNVTDLLPDRRNPLAQLSYFLRNFLRRFHTVCSDSLGSENVRSNRDQLPPATYCFWRTFELRDCAGPFWARARSVKMIGSPGYGSASRMR